MLHIYENRATIMPISHSLAISKLPKTNFPVRGNYVLIRELNRSILILTPAPIYDSTFLYLYVCICRWAILIKNLRICSLTLYNLIPRTDQIDSYPYSLIIKCKVNWKVPMHIFYKNIFLSSYILTICEGIYKRIPPNLSFLHWSYIGIYFKDLESGECL